MADLQDYIDVAPDVMATGDFSVTQVENKLASIPGPPSPPTPPDVTKAKVLDLFDIVTTTWSFNKSIEAAGGINEVAKTVQLWPSQVRELVRQFKAMKAVYDGDQ